MKAATSPGRWTRGFKDNGITVHAYLDYTRLDQMLVGDKR